MMPRDGLGGPSGISSNCRGWDSDHACFLQVEYEMANIIVAIIINIIFVYLVLKSSARIEKILGSQGINVIRKVFGVILLAIAIKLFAENIQSLFS